MPAEPEIKRAVSFIDGQNLYRHAKDAFGHHHPNYDPRKLADAVCADRGWINCGVRFYTGVPSADKSPMWHGYWTRRLTAMRRAGISVTSRSLRYRVETIRLPDGSIHELPVERERESISGLASTWCAWRETRSWMWRSSSVRTRTSARSRARFVTSREAQIAG